MSSNKRIGAARDFALASRDWPGSSDFPGLHVSDFLWAQQNVHYLIIPKGDTFKLIENLINNGKYNDMTHIEHILKIRDNDYISGFAASARITPFKDITQMERLGLGLTQAEFKDLERQMINVEAVMVLTLDPRFHTLVKETEENQPSMKIYNYEFKPKLNA